MSDITIKGSGANPETPLTWHPGNFIATQPGQVVENLDIEGRLFLDAPCVTIRNCYVRSWMGMTR